MSKSQEQSSAVSCHGQQRNFVEQAVKSALLQAGYPLARSIVCEFERGTIRLWGKVPSYYLKQVVSIVAAKVEGVIEVNNHLQVDGLK